MARTSPWGTADARILVASTLSGLSAVLAAWLATSATARVADQILWINVGAAGVLIIAAGNYRWLTHGRRAVSVRQRQVRERIGGVVVVDDAARRGDDAPGARVAAAGMTRYHRTGCPVAAGKPVQVDTVAAHERAGRRPCEMCRS